jgi:hypothetical protein
MVGFLHDFERKLFVLWDYEKQSSIVFLNLLLNSLFWNSFTRSRAKLPPGNAVTTINIFNYSAVNGWLPARLREEIIWNSTANLTALPGGNLALDLVNEFQNNDFKSKFKKTILLCFSVISLILNSKTENLYLI